MQPADNQDNKENTEKNLSPFVLSNAHISKWKYAYACEIGTSHLASNTAKQDFCLVEEKTINNISYLFCAAADGAGSAKYSDVSSRYISKLFIKKAKTFLEENEITSLDKETIKRWFTFFQKVLLRAKNIYNISSTREFSTTLLFVILSEKGNIFIQIGDGIIAKGDNSDFECVFLPQNGEYLNTTFFATDKNIIEQFMFKFDTQKIKRLVLHTDGIEIISFDFKNKKPHFNFFNPFFNMLEKSDTAGYNNEISDYISGFLSCERVNQKTDDDKTLIIVSCIAD